MVFDGRKGREHVEHQKYALVGMSVVSDMRGMAGNMLSMMNLPLWICSKYHPLIISLLAKEKYALSLRLSGLASIWYMVTAEI